MAVVIVAAPLPAALPAHAAPQRDAPAVQDRREPVRGKARAVRPRGADAARAAAITKAPAVAWPSVGTADLHLTGSSVRLGGLTVSATAQGPRAQAAPANPARLRVQVLDRAAADRAGLGGPLLRVAPADRSAAPGLVRLDLGYAGFAAAYGGDYGGRLRLVRVPDCALTEAGRPNCPAPQPVGSVNDGAKDVVSAEIEVAGAGSPALFALVADQASAQGSYGATGLAPSAKWSVAPSSGAFSWSYPMRTPPVPGGSAPQLALSYSSQSVDGRTAATNNQGSWIGEGFTYEPGYVERRYKPCADDGHQDSAEQCWSHQNATIVLGGRSGELVRLTDTEWKLSNDDGSRVERLTGATNGDNDGEHWKVTTSDGTQYFLGLNRLPGWTAGAEETASTWTSPVTGDDAGEPCHQSSLGNASCDQAWRWNLDYVRDRHDNVIAYFYERETNHYAKGGRTDVNGAAYHRGGVLKRIDYGQRHNAVYAGDAPARVRFTTEERCLPAPGVTCAPGSLTAATAPSWPDVPFDRYCAPNTRCRADQASVSYWTRKRLVKVTTEIRSGGDWQPVDSWSLGHLFTDNGDGSRTLWLNKIDHAGHVGGNAAVPSVELHGRQLANRVDTPNDHISPLIRFRVAAVYTDAGGQLDVNYAPVECAPGNLPRPGESTRRCYPVVWNATGTKEPITDWFHKYVVAEVIESDRTGGGPQMVKRYEYLGDAAWRHADRDGITEDKYLTWNQWRGYRQVRVTGGDGQTMTTRTEHTYLRGMHGDRLPGGGTRSVSTTDSTGAPHTDHDELSGFELETTTYDGQDLVAKQVTTPWLHHTATQTLPWGANRAFFVRPGTVRAFSLLAAGGWRETRTINSYDPVHGRVTAVDDLADVTAPEDDRCIRTEYADNPSAGILTLPARVETVSVHCGAAVDRRTRVISDDLTLYDNQPLGAAPRHGDPTTVRRLASHDGTTARYENVTTSTFDQWGRPLVVTDAAGASTRIGYTQTDGLTTRKQETGPLGFGTVTEYLPAWGVPAAQVDPNGKRVDLGYDPLGRLTAVWLADRPRASGASPSIRYSYTLRTDAVVAVKTEKLQNDGGYHAEYQLYDGHLRPRQIQTEGPESGRLVADTFYTGTGKIATTYATYHAAGAPSDRLLAVDNGDVDGQTHYRYDGTDRVTHEIFAVAGEQKWQTVTRYDGDQTHVDPPAGATPSTTITDARGNVVERRQYRGFAPTGAEFDRTRYTYTASGRIQTVTDPAGNVWRYAYDQRGRPVKVEDPDAGTSIVGYDAMDRPSTVVDGRGVHREHSYDAMGRKTATYQVNGATRTKLTEWTYDRVAKGYLYSTSRFVNGHVYQVINASLDHAYRPTMTRYVIPDDAGVGLKGTYDFDTTYKSDGKVQSVGMPAVGGLPAEAVVTSYDRLGRPIGLAGASPYVTRTRYAQTNELLQVELNTGARKAWLTWTYEEGSKRLAQSRVDRQDVAVTDSDRRYHYDDAGNLLSIADLPAGGPADVQCFQVDHLRRLTRAWTSASNAEDRCAGGPAATGVGGPAPYHHAFTFDLTGNRTTETIHGGSAASDVTRTYHYPPAGQRQPHALTQVTERTPAGDRLYRYTYDDAGNTTGRALVDRRQTLTWDAEGQLASVAEGDRTTTYRYDADGERLVRKDPGATTLYLPGMELRQDHRNGSVTGTRYYSFAGMAVAVRAPDGVKFLAADHHGSAEASIDATSGEITWRRSAPFGTPRGTPPGSFPTERGFVGGTHDPTTGLVHLGAREYDPALGRFVSIDPIIDNSDPQQMHGYAYANNNPVTFSDPDGLCAGREEGDLCPGHTRGPWAANDDEARDRHFRGKSGGGGGGGGGGSPLDKELRDAKEAAERAKQKLIQAAKALLKIAMDELGITAALDCFTTGDLGSCAETAVNVASTLVGGLLGKIATRYGAPWKWKKAYELGKKIGGLLGDLVSGVKSWWKNSKLAERLGRQADSCNSFVPGTAVLLADGSAKPIEEVDVGDLIPATDPETGETSSKTVVATIVGTGVKILVEVTVDLDGDAGKAEGSVTATYNHPFWVQSERRWLDAIKLRAGHLLRTAAGTYVQVTAVKVRWQYQRVHNLTVADTHTYYVVAGKTPVVVHNSNGEVCEVFIDGNRYPESARHIEDAEAAGIPVEGPIDRAGATARRREGLRGHPRVPGCDLDECPPAVIRAPGSPVSVRPIRSGDNRGSGAVLGNSLRGLADGTMVRLKVKYE